ncbi:MAG TPA: ABC transporter permease, partial [Actinomycetota bacterium]|nr:ABC transporter permease [Actinomycetota bacterium]
MSTAVADPAIRDWRQLLVDRPAVALSGVLLLLYVITGLFAPGMFTPNGVRSTLLLACPLAILAASQTLCMLTGGIDLSTVMTANFAAYVAANQSGQG